MPPLRPSHRLGTSGKRWGIFDLIDNYWNQIEGDFATLLHGTDARAWIRGERPWDQFLNYCDTIAQDEGGQLWAAQLSDSRHDAAIEERLAEIGDTDGRPPLVGYTAEIKALDRVANQIRLLINAMTPNRLGFIEGPAGPTERIKKQRRSLNDALVDAALGYTEVSSNGNGL